MSSIGGDSDSGINYSAVAAAAVAAWMAEGAAAAAGSRTRRRLNTLAPNIDNETFCGSCCSPQSSQKVWWRPSLDVTSLLRLRQREQHQPDGETTNVCRTNYLCGLFIFPISVIPPPFLGGYNLVLFPLSGSCTELQWERAGTAYRAAPAERASERRYARN